MNLRKEFSTGHFRTCSPDRYYNKAYENTTHSKGTLMIGRTVQKRSLTEKQQEDLDLFEALKPYLGQCLTLNHDLNNPLSGIMGFTEFLLEESDQLSEEHREFVVQINQCAERMHQVLNCLCEKKIALSAKVDIASVIEKYQPSDKLSD